MKKQIQLDEFNSNKVKNFLKFYQFENEIFDTGKKLYLGNKKNKICRFCNKKSPEVKFRKEAHVIPEFLGNKNILSYFECDNCNGEIFTKYEDSFASFIGATRTFSQIKGKKGKVPKHIEKKTGLEILSNEKGLEIKTLQGLDTTILNPDNKTLTIKTIKQSYVPLFVMKSLIKIGLCLVKDEELNNFLFSKKLLLSNKIDGSVNNSDMFRLFMYFIPGPTYYLKPSAYLYTRINNKLLVPEKIIILTFGNHQYQIFLPNSNNDKYLKGKQINVPIFPLIIDNSYFDKYGKYQFFSLNMSSNKLKKEEEHNINLHFDSFTKLI
jgi:hypothetical protein